MKVWLLLFMLFTTLISSNNHEISVRFNENEILKKRSEVQLLLDGKKSEYLQFSENGVVFGRNELQRKGMKWYLMVDNHVRYSANIELKEIFDSEGKSILKSKGLSKNRRKWYYSDSGAVYSTTKLTQESKGWKIVSANVDVYDELAQLVLLERIFYYRNVIISSSYSASF